MTERQESGAGPEGEDRREGAPGYDLDEQAAIRDLQAEDAAAAEPPDPPEALEGGK